MRQPDDPLLSAIFRLSRDRQASTAYTYGTLERLLKSLGPHQALLLSFFSGDAPTFEPGVSTVDLGDRPHSGDANHDFEHASLLSQLTGLAIAVVSKAVDTVLFVHEDVLVENIAFKDLSCQLLDSVQREYGLRVSIL